jgi:CBS-domain-containing membrane protein
MKVRDVMITDVTTVRSNTTLKEAALLAEEQQIGALPVVDRHNNLVGLVTHTDLNHLLAQLLGFTQEGTRLYITGLSGPKDASRYQIMEIISKYHAVILSAFSVIPPVTQQDNFIVHLDTDRLGDIAEEIRKLGLEVEMRDH